MNFSENLKTFSTGTVAAAVVFTGVVLISACGQVQMQEQPAVYPEPEVATETAEQTSRAKIEQAAGARSANEGSSMTNRMVLDSIGAGASTVTDDAIIAQHPVFRDYDYYVPAEHENYQSIETNQVKRVAEQPVSTFSVDVDTGAYSNVRRFLENGFLPPEDAVRAEELINYFDYAYNPPATDEVPFSINTLLMPTPWNESTSLLRIGLRGYEVETEELPDSNLVFLIDVSGSMNRNDKLPLLKRSMQLLTRKMRNNDRIAVVVYAGESGVALESTPGDQKSKINRSIKALKAGGSTHGSAGISLAYEIAQENFIENGINRVILATDGDFNVGTVDIDELIKMIENRRDGGISLTTLGFGSGNLNDHLMEQLADSGNGNYAYIDTLSEANKVLVDEMSSTLHTIASDVKIQIEFNPQIVAEYRLIGYENRKLRREDFNNDKVDAGEIGAGHTVTAIYEIALAGSGGERIEPLRYANRPDSNVEVTTDSEVAHIRLRYKQPGQSRSKRIEQSVAIQDRLKRVDDASDDARFSAAVAAFAQKLRGSEYLGDFDFAAIRKLAKNARGDDEFGYRAEFLTLVSLASGLQPLKVSVNERQSQ